MNWLKKLSNTNTIQLLDNLQATKNSGRGIECVRTLLFYLRRGELDKAQAVYFNESDKITSYPDVDKLIKIILTPPDLQND